MTLAIVLGVLAVLAVVAVVAYARSEKKKFAEANEVVPGFPTTAPASWAGEHSPEARLHRRLGDAVAALSANPEIDRLGLLEARLALEHQARTVDERLVAVAALPERVRVEPLARLIAAVEAVEEAAAQLVAAGPALEGRTALDEAMVRVEERIALLSAARTELDTPAAESAPAESAPPPPAPAPPPAPRPETG